MQFESALMALDEKTVSFCMNGQLLIAGLDSGIETKRGIGGAICRCHLDRRPWSGSIGSR